MVARFAAKSKADWRDKSGTKLKIFSASVRVPLRRLKVRFKSLLERLSAKAFKSVELKFSPLV
jgi:hypothetical protein